MQYGNESDTSYRIWAEGRFKSYYVVWKQVMVDAKAKKKEEFKSYYVVWKQNHIDFVWYRHFGLNRTMQYGNNKLNNKNNIKNIV